MPVARQRVPEGPAPDPPVQRLRVRYAKRGRLRFSSTRDFQRALERALRRAEVPVAFSAGFHPHPKISYANAAPTGTASEAEYFELLLRREVDPVQVQAALDEALPEGLDVVAVAIAAPGALADRLQASEWLLDFGSDDGPQLHQVVQRFAALERAEISRMTKRGERVFDTRDAVLATQVDAGTVRLVLRHDTPLVRPDDVVQAWRIHAGMGAGNAPLMTRLAQGPLEADNRIGDPLQV